MLSHMLLSLSARHAQFAGLPQGLSRHVASSLPPGDQDYSGILLVLHLTTHAQYFVGSLPCRVAALLTRGRISECSRREERLTLSLHLIIKSLLMTVDGCNQVQNILDKELLLAIRQYMTLFFSSLVHLFNPFIIYSGLSKPLNVTRV